MTLPALHVVTDDGVLAATGFAARSAALLEAHGPRVALQLRGHGIPAAAVDRLAEALAPVARASGALLLVNDRPDLALAVGCGVQLGRRSVPVAAARRMLGPGAPLGFSAHDAAEAADAAAGGADFVVVGTIWTTASHPDRPAAGTGLLAAAAERAGVPVVAIGGVTPERVADALAAGAAGVAVLSGVWSAPDPVAAARTYLDALEQG